MGFRTTCLWFFGVMLYPIILTSLQQISTATIDSKFRRESKPQWKVKFKPENITAHMNTEQKIEVGITDIEVDNLNVISFRFKSDNEDLAEVDDIVLGTQIDATGKSWRGNITIHAKFLGSTKIYVAMSNSLDKTIVLSEEYIDIIIIRKKRIIDHVFTGSVILLVSLLYINFGAALDLQVLKGLITRPVSPGIGFFCQCILMPLLSFAVGHYVFPHNIEMQLGIFFTGVSPTGGASNLWTVILGGNMNLSVLMTSISNLAAFGMMPLWIFTLGNVIFTRGNLQVPYAKIVTYCVGLIVPLAIGIVLQKWTPRISHILIILAGLLLPWLGYIISWSMAKLLRQNSKDSLTIAIETGIQNTGIAIFLLNTLPQPQADLTIVIPVAVDIMTMFPLLGLYIYQKCTGHNIKEGTLSEHQHSVRGYNVY